MAVAELKTHTFQPDESVVVQAQKWCFGELTEPYRCLVAPSEALPGPRFHSFSIICLKVSLRAFLAGPGSDPHVASIAIISWAVSSPDELT